MMMLARNDSIGHSREEELYMHCYYLLAYSVGIRIKEGVLHFQNAKNQTFKAGITLPSMLQTP